MEFSMPLGNYTKVVLERPHPTDRIKLEVTERVLDSEQKWVDQTAAVWLEEEQFERLIEVAMAMRAR